MLVLSSRPGHCRKLTLSRLYGAIFLVFNIYVFQLEPNLGVEGGEGTARYIELGAVELAMNISPHPFTQESFF